MQSSTKPLVCALAVLIAASFGGGVRAQSNAPSQQSDVTLGTSEVTLDVVARDKQGHPVTNLKESDFTVSEDGIEQEVTSFRLVKPPPVNVDKETKAAAPSHTTITPTTPAPRTVTTAPEDMKAIAIVFDRLSPEARALANKAATKYVADNFREGDAVGVFLIDLGLISLQPYTTEKDQIVAAVQEAGLKSGAAFRSQQAQADRIKGSNTGTASTDVEAGAPSIADAAGGVAAPGQAGEAQGTQGADAQLQAMQARSAEAFERLERQQQGYATTDGLLGVIEGLKLLPGRKAILFFSEGVKIPPQVSRQFEAVISSANLARVTVYTIDAAGLRVASPETATAATANAIGRRRMNEIGTPNEGRDRMLAWDLERTQDAMQSNVHASLGRLAKETGGYMVSETNDMGGKLKQVDEDLRTYYVLSYTPKNSNYDGSFRRVAVNVGRGDVSVQTREGYYAIDLPNAPPVLPYEAPAVAAATAKVTPTAFPIRSLAASFPESDRPGLVPVIVSVPPGPVTFMQNNVKKTFATSFAVVVLVRDEANQIVAKTSKEIILYGPLEKMEETRKSGLLYYAELDLAPGRYTVEAAAFDAPTRKASVQRTPLVVRPADGDGPRLSSVTIVDRVEKADASTDEATNPYRVGQEILYPNLGTPLKQSADAKLAFYVTAYLGHAEVKPPQATLEVQQNGRKLAQLPIDLPAPDAQGRIRYTNAFPLAPFPPGTYELHVTVTDGTHASTRSTRFVVTG